MQLVMNPNDKYYRSFENSRIRGVHIKIEPRTIRKQEQDQEKEKDQPAIEVKKISKPTINTISDLIALANENPYSKEVRYENVNMKALHDILPFMIQINDMIGIDSIKRDITRQIIYYMQPFDQGDYKHIIISGPPGTGKTELAKLIANIFSRLGVFGTDVVKFKKASRNDLVAGYLGQTAIKTSEVIKSSLGGVLFIDEAYSLGGSGDKMDSYSKECIDTLCESMSVHKDNLMVIIAGYERELNECFFSYNQGLKSRFPWKYTISGYTAEELYCMFILKLTKFRQFEHVKEQMVQWFSKRMRDFSSFGRDIDTFISKIKIVYSNRMFCCEWGAPIIMDDINAGYAMIATTTKPTVSYSFYS